MLCHDMSCHIACRGKQRVSPHGACIRHLECRMPCRTSLQTWSDILCVLCVVAPNAFRLLCLGALACDLHTHTLCVYVYVCACVVVQVAERFEQGLATTAKVHLLLVLPFPHARTSYVSKLRRAHSISMHACTRARI